MRLPLAIDVAASLSALLQADVPVGTGLHLVLGGEAVHVQRHRDLQQAVEVDKRLPFRHVAEAADVGGLALVFERIPLAYPEAGLV